MDYVNLNKKYNDIKNSNLYNDSQLEIIKYAIYREDINENIILNPNIPSEYMFMYIKLIQDKIDISKYIHNNWHTLGYPANTLKYIIKADSLNININIFNKDMNENEIKFILSKELDNKRKEKLLNNQSFDNNILKQLKQLDLDLNILSLLLSKSKEMDISIFLIPKIKSFSFEQIKYLLSMYSIGEDINKIFDSNLSVEEMKNIMLNSNNSIDFLEEIKENNKMRNH